MQFDDKNAEFGMPKISKNTKPFFFWGGGRKKQTGVGLRRGAALQLKKALKMEGR